MSPPIRIRGLAYDPYAAMEGREPSPWMGWLADGRWVALTQRRYLAADRSMDAREKREAQDKERRDLMDQALLGSPAGWR